MRQRLTEMWYAPARPSLLQPLAWLYGAVVRARRALYGAGVLRRVPSAVATIVIGNLTVGGTGKTPLTLWLAAALGGRGLKVGILSRGYGGSARGVTRVAAGASWRTVGDEPLLLALRSGCATVVARDRAAGAAALAADGVDVILADDGLQHLRLARDCQLVVVDGRRGFGNGRLLPAGPLREPLAQLDRVDLVIVNGAAEHPSLAGLPATRTLAMQLTATQALALNGGGSRALAAFRGERVHAVAGIGNPARFFATLRAHGIEVLEHPFPDHHPLSLEDLAFGDAAPVLMTEKDAVKCTGFADARLWSVPVSASFSEADAQRLLHRVLASIESRKAA
ncbi:MAG: tetraacyldisaccharide 4'-kinase [Proteobacteria bacterium]|nr:tetraacyldisaccharide 4'-kinase [Pseudomonadota bacterium]